MASRELRDRIVKALENLPPESLEGVLEYIQSIQEPDEAVPTADELEAIKRGEEEYSRGEYVRWRDKRNALRGDPHKDR
ncbi:MAG: hypothetical protein WAW37_11395 [Syntrophobacteraceae bacterium]